MPQCLVIGGGLIGLLTARELARAGRRVIVLERGTAGCESSWAGGGILSPLYPWRVPDSVHRLAAWSQRHYAEITESLREATGVDPEWTRSGLLVMGADEAARARPWAAAHDVDLRLIEGADGIRAIEPACRPDEQALWLPDVAHVRNPRFIAALVRDLAARGVEIREHTEVRDLLVERGSVRGVKTAREVLEARTLVVAGGAWSKALLERSGVGVDVEPVRGQMLLYRAAPGMIRRIVMRDGHYVIPRRDGHVLVGSTVEHVGFDKSGTDAARRMLAQAAETLIPALGGYGIERHWAGLRPGSATGVPLIGPAPGIDGLYVNTGHYRNGVVLGPASARLMADLVLQRECIVDPGPYALRP